MKWYTLENGQLCLGTSQATTKTNFHVATNVKLSSPLSVPLLKEHVDLIGSYPEDWYSDQNIELNINKTAQHFFGMTPNSQFA
ncbi:hypothetical protein ACUR5C_09305 [Aliikangiella sp. IMCC44653]